MARDVDLLYLVELLLTNSFVSFFLLRRAISQPELLAGESPLPKFVADYDTSFKEVRPGGKASFKEFSVIVSGEGTMHPMVMAPVPSSISVLSMV